MFQALKALSIGPVHTCVVTKATKEIDAALGVVPFRDVSRTMASLRSVTVSFQSREAANASAQIQNRRLNQAHFTQTSVEIENNSFYFQAWNIKDCQKTQRCHTLVQNLLW